MIRVYTTQQFKKVLKYNGYELIRTSKHLIYSNGENQIQIPKSDIKPSLQDGLIRRYGLKEF